MSLIPRRSALAAVTLAALIGALPLRTAMAEGTVIPLPSADREEIEKLLGKGVVGEAQAAGPLGSPESYLPLKSASMSYQVIDKNKKRGEAHKLEGTTDAAFAPGWHYSIENAGAAFFQKAPDGSLHTVAEQDLGNKVLSRFVPGEPMIIPGLKPGESRKTTLQVSVYDLSDLKKVTHSGSLDVTYTYIGYYDGGAFGIPYSSKNQQAALLFLQYIGQASVQADWAVAGSRITHQATYDDPKVKEMDAKTDGYFTLMKNDGKLFAGAPAYPFHAQVREATAPFFYEAITGALSPSDALDKMAEAAEAELKNLGYRK